MVKIHNNRDDRHSVFPSETNAANHRAAADATTATADKLISRRPIVCNQIAHLLI
jgi:hypothetical protein